MNKNIKKVLIGGLVVSFIFFLSIFIKHNRKIKEEIAFLVNGFSANGIYIDVNNTDIKINKGSNFSCKTNNPFVNCELLGNKVVISEKRNINVRNNYYITLVVPEAKMYNNIIIESDNSYIDINYLYAEVIDIETEKGSINFDYIKSTKKTELSLNSGDININDGIINDFEVESNSGDNNISAKIEGNISFELNTGSLNMNLKNNLEEFSFEIEKGIGDILINNELYKSGNYGNGSKIIDIESLNGTIKINTIN